MMVLQEIVDWEQIFGELVLAAMQLELERMLELVHVLELAVLPPFAG